jgi:hypothetical protein
MAQRLSSRGRGAANSSEPAEKAPRRRRIIIDQAVPQPEDISPSERQASVAQPALCCHVIEGVGGRVMSRYLGHAVPKAQVVFDLAVLPEIDEAMKLLEACLRNGSMPQVVIADGPLARRIVGPLLTRMQHVAVHYVLTAGLRWRADDWDAVRDLVALQRDHQDRLALLVIGGELCGAITALGGRALPVMLTPVPARRRPRMGRVALLLGRGTGETPSHGHVAAAAVLCLTAVEQRVGVILHPEDDTHLTTLLKTFGLAGRLIAYRSIEDALARLGGTPVVYVAPFPDGCLDQDALVVIDQGGLVLVGPQAVPLPDGAGELMYAREWEQADLLAAKLVSLVRDYHATWAMLHNRANEAIATLSAKPAAA